MPTLKSPNRGQRYNGPIELVYEIIAQSVRESLGNFRAGSARPADKPKLRAEAQDFVESSAFEGLCDLVGVDANVIRERAAEFAEEQE